MCKGLRVAVSHTSCRDALRVIRGREVWERARVGTWLRAWVRCAWRCGGARAVEPPEYYYSYIFVGSFQRGTLDQVYTRSEGKITGSYFLIGKPTSRLRCDAGGPSPVYPSGYMYWSYIKGW